MPPKIRIGTRGSPLALAQAEEVKARLAAAHADLATPGAVELVVIKTSGDRMLSVPLAEIGGKGLFTKEIEEALADGRIDIAVHSMKDMPTVLPEGLMVDCFLPREDPRDVLIARAAESLATLPAGAVVGTASLRRQAIVRNRRPDVVVIPFRGNVGTRLAKIAAGEADATLLALAGLKRLGKSDAAAAILSPDEMLPAVCQGIIGIERRAGDAATRDLLTPLNHAETSGRAAAERALLAGLDGSCRTPIAALAEIDGVTLSLRALIARPDGSEIIETSRVGAAADAVRLGADAAAELRHRGGRGFFADV